MAESSLRPMHAGAFQTLGHQSFAGGFDRARANEVAAFSEGLISHAVTVCLEVGPRFGSGLGLAGRERFARLSQEGVQVDAQEEIHPSASSISTGWGLVIFDEFHIAGDVFGRVVKVSDA